MRLCPWSLASSIPVLGLESVCPRKGCPWPWPRIFFLSLALASSLVSSTPPLWGTSLLSQVVLISLIKNDFELDRGVAKNGRTRGGISWWHPFSYQKYVTTKKEGLRCKIIGIWVQKYVKTKKKKSLPKNLGIFSPNEDGDNQTR